MLKDRFVETPSGYEKITVFDQIIYILVFGFIIFKTHSFVKDLKKPLPQKQYKIPRNVM